jgi:glycosyltransferase involved in cell wall biosynthesis
MSGGELRILVVIPFYNHGRTVAEVTSQVLALGWPLLVVNDGSTDGGPASLRDLPLHRIDFPRNRGKGRALRHALRWARERSYSHIVSLDADGQHSPSDIARFAEKIRRAPDTLIVGRRNFENDVPGKSRFGRSWSNMWVRIASGGRTPDSQSGFRAYPVEPLAGFTYFGARYEFEVEILVRAVWAGLPLDWVDVESRYFPPSGRVSHFRLFWDNFRISLIYTALVARNLLPLPFRRSRQGRTPSGPAGNPGSKRRGRDGSGRSWLRCRSSASWPGRSACTPGASGSTPGRPWPSIDGALPGPGLGSPWRPWRPGISYVAAVSSPRPTFRISPRRSAFSAGSFRPG